MSECEHDFSHMGRCVKCKRLAEELLTAATERLASAEERRREALAILRAVGTSGTRLGLLIALRDAERALAGDPPEEGGSTSV